MIVNVINAKEYNGKNKSLLMVNNEPIAIANPNRMNKILSYLTTGEGVISDGKIKKKLDKIREKEQINEISCTM